MRSLGFSHYILTRFNTMQDENGLYLYDKPGADEWMEKRMPLFEETKRSVLSQKASFKWVVSVDKRTPKRFMDKIFTDGIIETNQDIRHVFLTNEIDPATDWVITTRLDCDDRYLKGAIKAIQSRFVRRLKVIDIDYYQLEVSTNKLYTSKRKWANSMFLSLCEPSDRVLTAFCRPHGQVMSEYPHSGDYWRGLGDLRKIEGEKIRDAYALMVCHDNNVTNQIIGEYVGEFRMDLY